MTKYVVLIIFMMILCAGGLYERMSDVVMLCLAASGFLAFKVLQRMFRKQRKNVYYENSEIKL